MKLRFFSFTNTICSKPKKNSSNKSMLSARAQRRRANPSVTVRQAFEEGENENKPNTQFRSHENESSSDGQLDLDRVYERAYFTLNDSTIEVILNNDVLSWLTPNSETSHENTRRKTSKSIEEMNSVNLHDVYAISPIYQQNNWTFQSGDCQSSMDTSDSVFRGFQLHSYETGSDNILQEILIVFQSNSSNQIRQWFQLLSRKIHRYKPSRNVLVVCNPYAGGSRSRYVYQSKVRPMLDRANYKVTFSELDDNYSADNALDDFNGDFDSLYGVVILGGDGTVINVINAILRYLAKESRTRLHADNDLPTLPFPISIVPTGTTNILCHSIHGCTDHITSMLYFLFNKQMKIDMSAVFDVNYNFITANFCAGAGYPANVLKYFTRYASANPKKIIRKSFSKAALTKNLKCIDMEIRYIPADHDKVSLHRCYRGCPICTQQAVKESDDQVTAFNQGHVEKINTRKIPQSPNINNNNNNNLNYNNRPSSSLSKKSARRQTDTTKTWNILGRDYLQVAVLTNPCLWTFVPQGLSKFGHLADGLLDLVLIEPTTRKEFLRYIKRNANSKDQFDLSFARIIKVKEIELELKLPNDYLIDGTLSIDDRIDSSSASSDDSSNEENVHNDNETPFTVKHEPHPPNVPISEDSRRHRRRHHLHRNGNETDAPPNMYESWENLDTPKLHAKTRHRQNNNTDNQGNGSHTNLYGSNLSIRRKSIFQSLKSKFTKNSSSRPSSADINGRNSMDEKHNQQNRSSATGTLRPGRSLMNLLPDGNSAASSSSKKREQSSSIKHDASSVVTSASGHGRNSIARRRSSSIENENVALPTVDRQYRKKKQPCLWNLDFTPYNSPIIRIKCYHRFLSVFGLGLDPDTVLKSVNYPCFGRIG